MNTTPNKEKKDIRSATICGMSYDARKELEDQCEFLSKDCGVSLVMIGTDEERNALSAAIVGYDNATSSLIYDYDKLVECFMEWEDMTEEEAVEWVEYNTIRSLPYIKEGRPIIMNKFDL